MARVDDLVLAALKSLPPKPDDSADQAAKRRYSEQMSAAEQENEVALEQVMNDLVGLVAERNFDLYEEDGEGGIGKV